ncbi:hypothetical protein LPJ73_006888, partial [Coemansia sp. RSA 2703]
AFYFSNTAAGSEIWLGLTWALLHVFAILSNLDNSSKKSLGSILHAISHSQARRLVRLSKIGGLTLDELQHLPERLRLRNAYNDFKYDTRESLFLIRAIVRMIWRPLIPIYIADSLTQAFSIISRKLDSQILQILDDTTKNQWHKGYAIALAVTLCKLVSGQLSNVSNFSSNETERVTNALKLELFRLPLLRNGMQKRRSAYGEGYVHTLVRELESLNRMFSSIFTTAVTIWLVYRRVGWLGFIPIGVVSVHSALMWGVQRLFGRRYEWFDYWGDDDGELIDEIYDGIRSIKMYGWESMYLDAKHREKRRTKLFMPWYAPAVRAIWHLDDIVSSFIQDFAVYTALYLHIHTHSGSAVVLTNAQLFELTEDIRSMRGNLSSLVNHLGRIRELVRANIKLERILRGDFINTLPYTSEPDSVAPPDSIISMNGCDFNWKKKRAFIKGATFSAGRNELVAVVGKTGSGKSSLLQAMCGEMDMTRGTGHISGSIGYLTQSPWIMNDTFRANVVF